MKRNLFTPIRCCRICGNTNLRSILNLGNFALTGIFPKKNQKIERAPIELIKCVGGKSISCGLLQLRHNFDRNKMYGDNYGYESALNSSMVDHLKWIVQHITSLVDMQTGDIVIDIGSNDGTLLKQYKKRGLKLYGIDPTIKKFGNHYPDHIHQIPEFFSGKRFSNQINKKAKIITSIAMFYDLENPLTFVQEVASILADDGVWVFEQSYMPKMLTDTMYDTVCHEHLEYYGLNQILWLLKQTNLKIVDIKLTDTNGGSFFVAAAHKNSNYKEAFTKINALKIYENKLGLDQLNVYKKFAQRVNNHKKKLRLFFEKLKKEGKVAYGYGASTKGNVILQHCEITNNELPFIAEVNNYKVGRYTPGTGIPIISEEEARKHKPDYFFVFPWHFKKNIIKREGQFIQAGGTLVFPLPKFEFIHK